MKKWMTLIFAGLFLISACGKITGPVVSQPSIVPTIDVATKTPKTVPPTYTPTATQVAATSTFTPTPTITLTPTPAYPLQGRGPTGFDPGVNPLTGLEIADPQLLERRPIVIKVENLPREHRPQWGVSLADLVYEYYTEFGGTRFAAIYYGKDAEQVGPIRSGRFFDANIVQMYKAIFIYGSAYPDVQSRFFNSDFYQRLVLETTRSCPTLCRTDPNGQNLLVANTSTLGEYLASRSVDNARQNLDGMFFQSQVPGGGTPAPKVYLRYSGAIYNRWDYDPLTASYMRFVDAADDVNRNNEVYTLLTDKLTGTPVTAQNVLTICVPHQYYVKRDDAEVLDIIMDSNRIASYTACDGEVYTGSNGPAYVSRDGQVYKVIWQRAKRDSVLTLIQADGSPFPLKPGNTWVEVIGASSTVEQVEDGSWHFIHHMTP